MFGDSSRTSVTTYGVWFFDEASLRDLDTLILEQLKKLKKKRSRDIASETRSQERRLRELHSDDESRFSARFDEAKKAIREAHKGASIELFISDEQQQLLKCESFAEAVESSAIIKEVPTRFRVVIRAGRNKVDITLGRSSFSGDELVADFPAHEPLSDSVSNAIRNWAENCRQPTLLCLWNRHSFLSFLIAMMGGWLLTIFFAQSKTVTPNTDALRQEASALIERGVSEENRDEALSLLLQAFLGEAPRKEMVFSPWLSLGILLAAIAFVFVVASPPRSLLGIGRGKPVMARRIQWYRFWTKSLPFFVIVCIGLAIVQEVLGSWVYDRLSTWFK